MVCHGRLACLAIGFVLSFFTAGASESDVDPLAIEHATMTYHNGKEGTHAVVDEDDFKKIDADGDGRISAEDVVPFAQQMLSSVFPKPDDYPYVKQLDTNGDETISKEEWEKGDWPDLENSKLYWLIASLRWMVKTADVDMNGAVTYADLTDAGFTEDAYASGEAAGSDAKSEEL